MKKLFILIFVLLIFLYLIIYNYFRQNFVYKEELNTYYPEVIFIEIFRDNLDSSYYINIQGLFYAKNSPRDMPIFISNKLENIADNIVGYDQVYQEIKHLYMNNKSIENYKLNYEMKNKGLELFYFQIKFKTKNSQDLKYKYILEEIIKNKKINVFRYQRKDMMGGTIYISDPFAINFNDEQINNLNAIYNEIF